MPSSPAQATAANEQQGQASLNQAAEALWEAAQPRWPTLSMEVLPQCPSTNAHALSLGRAGVCEPTVVVAWDQTAGRGRSGRSWQAQPGQSLAMSLALPMDLGAVPDGGALSLAVGVMVAEALNILLERAAQAPSVQLKWPNDLWAQQRKLGGILIEAIASPALPPQQRWVVIGLGLNLAGQPEASTEPRTDLAQAGLNHPALTPAQAMRAVVPALLDGLAVFAQQGFAPFKTAYDQLDGLRGHDVALWQQGWAADCPPDIQGRAMGVDEHGALLIHDGQRQTQAWTIGEVSVRVRAHPL